jgi:hypothetical protein
VALLDRPRPRQHCKAYRCSTEVGPLEKELGLKKVGLSMEVEQLIGP